MTLSTSYCHFDKLVDPLLCMYMYAERMRTAKNPVVNRRTLPHSLIQLINISYYIMTNVHNNVEFAHGGFLLNSVNPVGVSQSFFLTRGRRTFCHVVAIFLPRQQLRF